MFIDNHSASLIAPEQKPKTVSKMYSPISTVLFTIAVYFMTQIAGGVIILAYPLIRGWGTASTEHWLSSSVVAQFFLILAIESLVILAVYMLLKARKLKIKSIGLVKPKLGDLGYAIIGFGLYFVIYIAIFLIIQQFVPQINLDQKQEIGFDTSQTGINLVWVFLSLVILPPIAEEILCRGFLYTGLRSKLKYWPAAVIASVLFALAHLQFGSGAPLLWAAALDTFILSMVLVYLRETRGSLTAPIVLHVLKNGMAFMLLFIFKVG